jgi:hypothetical protein
LVCVGGKVVREDRCRRICAGIALGENGFHGI